MNYLGTLILSCDFKVLSVMISNSFSTNVCLRKLSMRLVGFSVFLLATVITDTLFNNILTPTLYILIQKIISKIYFKVLITKERKSI